MKKVLNVLVDRLNYRDEGIKGSKFGELGVGNDVSTKKGILGEKVNFEQRNFNCLGNTKLEMNI